MTLELACYSLFLLVLGGWLIAWNVRRIRAEKRKRAMLRHLEEICK